MIRDHLSVVGCLLPETSSPLKLTPNPPVGRNRLCTLSVHSPSAGGGPAPSADGLVKTALRPILFPKREHSRFEGVSLPAAHCLLPTAYCPLFFPAPESLATSPYCSTTISA